MHACTPTSTQAAGRPFRALQSGASGRGIPPSASTSMRAHQRPTQAAGACHASAPPASSIAPARALRRLVPPAMTADFAARSAATIMLCCDCPCCDQWLGGLADVCAEVCSEYLRCGVCRTAAGVTGPGRSSADGEDGLPQGPRRKADARKNCGSDAPVSNLLTSTAQSRPAQRRCT
jgi:hypothetical protein